MKTLNDFEKNVMEQFFNEIDDNDLHTFTLDVYYDKVNNSLLNDILNKPKQLFNFVNIFDNIFELNNFFQENLILILILKIKLTMN